MHVVTPEMWRIVIYYVFAFILNVFFRILNKKKITTFEKRLINWKNLIKHLIRKKHKKLIPITPVIVILLLIVQISPKDLKIYFIDVGQGDCTLIVTPYNQTILIDGGGSENYDVGKNILIPYLLDRKITIIDYVIISHFDSDHAGRFAYCTRRVKSEKCNYFKTV